MDATVVTNSVFGPMATGLPEGADLDEIRADLAGDHVAAPSGKDQAELADLVAAARADGIELSVVVVPGNPWHDSQLRDLATEVGKFQHGTVAVFSDDWIGTDSDSISRVRLEWAEDKAKYKGGDTAEAVGVFAQRLEQPEGISWSVLTGVLIAIAVLLVGGLAWVKARRRAAEHR